MELKWASDSLFLEVKNDTVLEKIDSTSLKSEKKSNSKFNNNTQKEVTKEKQTNNSENKEDEQKNNDNKVIEFAEPKAITLEQAKLLFDNSVQFIDARDHADYQAGHIVNSINIPFDDFENHKQKLDSLSNKNPYVIYCAGTECDLSILLGNKLFELGYKQLYIFFGGWNDWLNAKYPIEVKHN